MTKQYLRYLLLLLIFLSLTGCAKEAVRKLGTYQSEQRPERAVVMRDGVVVVDFIEARQSGLTKSVRHYYKRVYFGAGDFRQIKAGQGVQPVLSDCALECRIVGYLDSTTADEESGRWIPLGPWLQTKDGTLAWLRTKDGLPRIPEQDQENICMYDGKAGVFHICDEAKQTIFDYKVKTWKEKKRQWWGYPAQVLYIPGAIIDVVMYPVFYLMYSMSQ